MAGNERYLTVQNTISRHKTLLTIDSWETTYSVEETMVPASDTTIIDFGEAVTHERLLFIIYY